MRYQHSKRSRGVFDLADIPYRSQEDPGSRSFANDCGSAVAGMILEWRGQNYTTDQLSSETSLSKIDNGLFTWEVGALLFNHGVKTRVVTDVKAAIDDGQPCICLIHYWPILARQNQADRSDHFQLAVGYNDQGMRVLDSDYWGSRREEGNGLLIPWAQWDLAFIEALAVLP